MFDLLGASRHLLLAAAIDEHHTGSTHASRCPDGVHGRVAAPDDRYIASGKHRCVVTRLSGAHKVYACQIFVARHHSDIVLARNAHEAWKSGSRCHEESAESLRFKILEAESLSNDAILDKLNSSSLQCRYLFVDNGVGQTEFGYAVFQHTAYLVESLIHCY